MIEQNIYKQVLDQIQDAILIIDSDTNILYVNKQASIISGITTEHIGMNMLELKPQIDPKKSRLVNALNSDRAFLDYKETLINFDGQETDLVVSTFSLSSDGKIIGAFDVWRDVTYLNDLSNKLLKLQHTIIKSKHFSSKSLTSTKFSLSDIVGANHAIEQLKSKIQKISYSNSPVLVYGETGTGKELFVQSIHSESTRSTKPFIAQNCAAIPSTLLESTLFGTTAGSFTGSVDRPGLFELADGGTLYLDEINSMDIELQAKLLRVIQDGVIRKVGSTKQTKVDVRIIASINESPEIVLKNVKIRSDLFYRLNVISLEIPPLRKRKDDLPLLVSHFIENYNHTLNKQVSNVSDNVMELFTIYDWPGNVRELRFAIESAMNFTEGSTIKVEDIPSHIFKSDRAILINQEPISQPLEKESVDFRVSVQQFERKLIVDALSRTDYNGAEAARLLNLPKQTLYNKMAKYKITSGPRQIY